MSSQTVRKVQEILSNDVELNDVDKDQFISLATELKKKRLTFAWLDGEAQQVSYLISFGLCC